MVPYIAGLGGNPGEDYLTFVAEDLCELGRQFVQFVAGANSEESIEIVELGGTPGNPAELRLAGLLRGRDREQRQP